MKININEAESTDDGNNENDAFKSALNSFKQAMVGLQQVLGSRGQGAPAVASQTTEVPDESKDSIPSTPGNQTKAAGKQPSQAGQNVSDEQKDMEETLKHLTTAIKGVTPENISKLAKALSQKGLRVVPK